MARGMAAGEPIVSQAQTKAFDEGYERTFGKRKVERGRFVWDERQQKLVRADQHVPPERALDAPVLVDRFYEGARATDGTDIGSRRRHREYMRVHGLAHESDFRECGAKAREERARFARGEQSDKPYIEAVERSIYELENKRRR